mgnify:CR=1 FL=1
MKFKVGDKVRYNRDFLIDAIETWDDFDRLAIYWFEIIQIEGEEVRSEDWSWFHENHLELVPEESKFKRWEIVEVQHAIGKKWEKRIFVWEIPWAKFPYICVDPATEENFLNWKKFTFFFWDKIRKFKQKLIRKEIAEKFWIDHDFELIED